MKKWIEVMRLRTLPLAASCTLMGSALGWRESRQPWLILSLSLFTTFLLQILSNLANDYGDHESGADNEERVGPKRAMQSGTITRLQMQRALVICTLLTLASGIALLWVSLAAEGMFKQALVFLCLGIMAIVAAFKYTVGKNPYGYRGLGDLFVFIFFGLVGVCGTYFLHAKTFSVWALLPAVVTGALSCAVLNLNNMRDHISDKIAGKATLVVKMGFDRAKAYHAFLLMSSFGAMFCFALFYGGVPFAFRYWWQWLCFLPFIPVFINMLTVLKCTQPALLDPELKKIALSTFFVSLLFFISLVFC